jgi:hypothetical protein|tara:strand:+ start:509 stop:847 length:339 start_codon:yes stop_codon:yes gene_type:complete
MNLADTLCAGKSALVLCESDYEAGVTAQKLHAYLRGSTILLQRNGVEYQGAVAQFVTVRLPDGRRPSEFDAVFSTFDMSTPGGAMLSPGGLSGQRVNQVENIRFPIPQGHFK